MNHQRKELSSKELIKQLYELEPTKTLFDKIIEASSVQEIMELHLKPEEIYSILNNIESLSSTFEKNFILAESFGRKLEKARPLKRRRAFFI